MEAEQETYKETHGEGETYIDEGDFAVPEDQEVGQQEEECEVFEEETEQRQENKEKDLLPNLALDNEGRDRRSFSHGLSVGLGIGCIATFVIMWIVVFFSPQLPSTITYEAMLSIFIYPLIYLLAIGLIALTAGIVKEYYVRKSSF